MPRVIEHTPLSPRGSSITPSDSISQVGDTSPDRPPKDRNAKRQIRKRQSGNQKRGQGDKGDKGDKRKKRFKGDDDDEEEDGNRDGGSGDEIQVLNLDQEQDRIKSEEGSVNSTITRPQPRKKHKSGVNGHSAKPSVKKETQEGPGRNASKGRLSPDAKRLIALEIIRRGIQHLDIPQLATDVSVL